MFPLQAEQGYTVILPEDYIACIEYSEGVLWL